MPTDLSFSSSGPLKSGADLDISFQAVTVDYTADADITLPTFIQVSGSQPTSTSNLAVSTGATVINAAGAQSYGQGTLGDQTAISLGGPQTHGNYNPERSIPALIDGGWVRGPNYTGNYTGFNPGAFNRDVFDVDPRHEYTWAPAFQSDSSQNNAFQVSGERGDDQSVRNALVEGGEIYGPVAVRNVREYYPVAVVPDAVPDTYGPDRIINYHTYFAPKYIDAGSGDPADDHDTFLLPFDGSFTDVIGNRSPTGHGNSVPTLSSSSKFGTGSVQFSGNYTDYAGGSHLSCAGDFTIELWVYPTRASSYENIFELGTYTDGILIRSYSAGGGSNQAQVNGQSFNITNGLAPINQWSHIAICRSGTTVRLFRNGVQLATLTVSGTINTGNGGLRFASANHASGQTSPQYIDDFRFTKFARYTTNFTPPGQLVDLGTQVPGPISLTNTRRFFSAHDTLIQGHSVFEPKILNATTRVYSTDIVGTPLNGGDTFGPIGIENLTTFITIQPPPLAPDVPGPNVTNWQTFVTPGFIDSSVVSEPKAINWHTYLTPDLIEQSWVMDPRSRIQQQYVRPALIDQSEIYEHDYTAERKTIHAGFVDQSETYGLEVFRLKELYVRAAPLPFIDSLTISEPKIFNWQTFVDVGLVDQSVVIQPNIQNWEQQFPAHTVVIDSSAVHGPASVANNRRFFGAHDLAIEGGSTYGPANIVYMRTIVPVLDTTSGTVHGPVVFNQTQIFGANDAINSSETFGPIEAKIMLTKVDVGLYEQSSVYGLAVAENADRRVSIGPSSSVGEVYGLQSIDNKNVSIRPDLVSSGSVTGPDSCTVLKYVVIVSDVPSGIVYGPVNIYNDATVVRPAFTELWNVYGVSTEIKRVIYDAAGVIDQSEVIYPDRAENVTRYYDFDLIQGTEVYGPIKTYSSLQEFGTPQAINTSEVYNVSVDLKNKKYEFDFTRDVSYVYDPAVFNSKQIVPEIGLTESSEVTGPNRISNWIQYVDLGLTSKHDVYGVNLVGAPAAEMAAVGSFGSEMIASDTALAVSTRHRIFIDDVYDGQAMLDTTLTEAVKPTFEPEVIEISARMENVPYMPDTFVGIKATGYEGVEEKASGTTIAIDPLIYIRSQETMLEVSMATTPVLPVGGASDGIEINVSLQDIPPFKIRSVAYINPDSGLPEPGILNKFHNDLGGALDVKYGGFVVPRNDNYLRPYPIRNGDNVRTDFYHPLYMDMQIACPPYDKETYLSNVNIDFDNDQPWWFRYYSDKLYMHAVLSCQVFLTPVTIQVGAEAFIREEPPLDVAKIFADLGHIDDYMLPGVDMRLELCKGNFLPSGNDFPLEIHFEPTACVEYKMWTGVAMLPVLLSISPQFSNVDSPMADGVVMGCPFQAKTPDNPYDTNIYAPKWVQKLNLPKTDENHKEYENRQIINEEVCYPGSLTTVSPCAIYYTGNGWYGGWQSDTLPEAEWLENPIGPWGSYIDYCAFFTRIEHDCDCLRIKNVFVAEWNYGKFYSDIGSEMKCVVTFFIPARIPNWFNWEVATIGVGSSMSVTRLHEDPNYFHHGESMLVSNLIVSVDILFLESGLILNEHIDQTEDGSADYDKSLEVSVEGDFFRHDLKAECK